MSEDRSVHTDALKTLGSVISETEQRDAIHLAVEPTIAKQRLHPGQHVGVSGTSDNPVGVVDPFLVDDVMPGERFWLIVYPRTITSLRHVWEHPLFRDAEQSTAKSASEKWMRAWAVEHVSYDYYGDSGDDHYGEQTAYDFAINAGYSHNIGPYEEARDTMKNEWWSHWEIITGKKGDRDTYFSCAC